MLWVYRLSPLFPLLYAIRLLSALLVSHLVSFIIIPPPLIDFSFPFSSYIDSRMSYIAFIGIEYLHIHPFFNLDLNVVKYIYIYFLFDLSRYQQIDPITITTNDFFWWISTRENEVQDKYCNGNWLESHSVWVYVKIIWYVITIIIISKHQVGVILQFPDYVIKWTHKWLLETDELASIHASFVTSDFLLLL